jgi:hypothetical protein
MVDPETNQRLGRFVETPVAGEMVRAFVPPPLPPSPPIDVLTLLDRLSLAERALGRLDGITMLLAIIYLANPVRLRHKEWVNEVRHVHPFRPLLSR